MIQLFYVSMEHCNGSAIKRTYPLEKYLAQNHPVWEWVASTLNNSTCTSKTDTPTNFGHLGDGSHLECEVMGCVKE